MKLPSRLIACLALAVSATVAFAATNAAPATPAKPKAPAAPTPPPAPAASAPLKLEDYINDLAKTLQLSDTDKKSIEDIYVADGDPMKTILNNDTLSPLQQAQQVSDLRDVRNAKIEAVLTDSTKQHEFLSLEAKYRVALTMLAAADGWVAAPPPAPAPATNAPATNAPAGTPPATNAPAAAKPASTQSIPKANDSRVL